MMLQIKNEAMRIAWFFVFLRANIAILRFSTMKTDDFKMKAYYNRVIGTTRGRENEGSAS
ncbi:hypothetical protein C4B60_04425 [Jeotgalibacillus proteolyticus]|uniref:Uncharacterized protein n=1 Tax=Jeotgalibacillus proteolyticus TaxID=2082395 RepID=A0A2S5GE88_9BACL|nr:hypothetical protein C4B60_04425 [Jeotgalibacillus proteolyticus]